MTFTHVWLTGYLIAAYNARIADGIVEILFFVCGCLLRCRQNHCGINRSMAEQVPFGCFFISFSFPFSFLGETPPLGHPSFAAAESDFVWEGRKPFQIREKHRAVLYVPSCVLKHIVFLPFVFPMAGRHSRPAVNVAICPIGCRQPATAKSAAICSLPCGGGLGRGHSPNFGNLSQQLNHRNTSLAACRPLSGFLPRERGL